MAEEVLGLPDAGLIAAVTSAVSCGDAKAGLESAAVLLESGCPVEQALEFFAARWRDFLVLRTCGKDTELVDLSPEARSLAADQAKQFEPHELVHFVAVCEAAIRSMRGSGSPRTIFDATIARLCLHREFQRMDIAAAHSARPIEGEKKKQLSPAPVAERVGAAPAHAETRAEPTFAAQQNVAPQITAPSFTKPAQNVAQPQVATANATHTSVTTALEAWQRVAAIATSTPERVLAESFVPVSMRDRQLTLRAAESAGGAANYAARKSEMLQSMVTRALGPGWKLEFETTAQAAPQAITPMHGLDKDLMQMPLIQAAMDAFDAIVVKVEQPSAQRVHENPPTDLAQA
jgi:DNA polymerase III gamma/tau subunit